VPLSLFSCATDVNTRLQRAVSKSDGPNARSIKVYYQELADRPLALEFLQRLGIEVIWHPEALRHIKRRCFSFLPNAPVDDSVLARPCRHLQSIVRLGNTIEDPIKWKNDIAEEARRTGETPHNWKGTAEEYSAHCLQLTSVYKKYLETHTELSLQFTEEEEAFCDEMSKIRSQMSEEDWERRREKEAPPAPCESLAAFRTMEQFYLQIEKPDLAPLLTSTADGCAECATVLFPPPSKSYTEGNFSSFEDEWGREMISCSEEQDDVAAEWGEKNPLAKRW
jgi:hypothetical protein